MLERVLLMILGVVISGGMCFGIGRAIHLAISKGSEVRRLRGWYILGWMIGGFNGAFQTCS